MDRQGPALHARAWASSRPPPHHDIYSIEDLAQLIHDLKNANHRRPHLGEAGGRGRRRHHRRRRRQGPRRRGAHLAATTAAPAPRRSPPSSTPASPGSWAWPRPTRCWCSTTCAAASRSRWTASSRPAATWSIGALLGAEEFGFATAPLVVAGLHHDARLPPQHLPGGRGHAGSRSCAPSFTGDPAHVVNFMRFIAQEVRELMAELGFRTVDEMVGRSERLEMRRAVDHWKARNLDFSPHPLQADGAAGTTAAPARSRRTTASSAALDATTLLDAVPPGPRARRSRSRPRLPIRNTNRVVGTMVGSEVTRRHGAAGPARGHHPPPLHGLGRPELRRLRPARHDPHRWRATPTTTSARGSRAASSSSSRPREADLRARGEHHHRQRGLLRRHRRRGLHPRRGRRALLRAQLRRATRWWRGWATTAAST